MNPVAALRIAGIVEGLSWLLLLFVAMPLKYGFGYPAAVSVVGAVHGGLFVFFCVLLLIVFLRYRWPLLRAAKLFVAALIPFGFLWVDRSLREDA